MKLLIVEDETHMADLLRKGLTEEGHNAICAYDGAEDWIWPRAMSSTSLFLTSLMPKLNGYDLAKRLRAEKNSDSDPHADRQGHSSRYCSWA